MWESLHLLFSLVTSFMFVGARMTRPELCVSVLLSTVLVLSSAVPGSHNYLIIYEAWIIRYISQRYDDFDNSLHIFEVVFLWQFILLICHINHVKVSECITKGKLLQRLLSKFSKFYMISVDYAQKLRLRVLLTHNYDFCRGIFNLIIKEYRTAIFELHFLHLYYTLLWKNKCLNKNT